MEITTSGKHQRAMARSWLRSITKQDGRRSACRGTVFVHKGMLMCYVPDAVSHLTAIAAGRGTPGDSTVVVVLMCRLCIR